MNSSVLHMNGSIRRLRGTLIVTPTIGHYITPTELLARFVYTRGGAPPS